MPKATINEAIIEALSREQKPMRVSDIYNRIKEDDLYRFNAVNPEHIVRTQLRRHSENLNFATAHKTKHFTFLKDGTFWLLGVSYDHALAEDEPASNEQPNLQALKELHDKYLVGFKSDMLVKVKELPPTSFEIFCKKLLEVYGFKEVKVTKQTRDGGIDGHGKLKIGFAFFNVAFECKRYSNKMIDRKTINQFRGDIQGKYEQGIFFTTSTFNKGAKDVSFQPGAVPIVMIDGPAIVDIMIEKKLGVERETIPIFYNAFDLVLQET